MPILTDSETLFHQRYPDFASTRALDELRASDYARLDRLGHVYLDYTGGGLYAESQIQQHVALLTGGVFGNPHSSNPTSQAMTELVEHTRRYILEYFHAAPDEYVAIFTQNASGALKLVGESYPFGPGGQYLLTFDNHNSVNGIREFARAKGAEVIYTPVLPPDMRLDETRLADHLDTPTGNVPRLFAYPAQSNFSGVQHPLDWIARAQAKGWEVLLDAAAFAPTNRLDLSVHHPDFVSLSFYKIFGYPTGMGCLLARKTALAKLHRPWFAGGTISYVSVSNQQHTLHEGAEAFEDGTLNYLAIPAIEIGLKHIARLGLEQIHTRVACLTGALLDDLTALYHTTGQALARIYGPVDTHQRGGTVTLNFYDQDGHFIDHQLVEQRANAAGISLRTGSFCNPGGGETALGITGEELRSCFSPADDRLTLTEFRRVIDQQSTGSVRISVGLVTTFADIYRFSQFARSFLDKRADEI